MPVTRTIDPFTWKTAEEYGYTADELARAFPFDAMTPEQEHLFARAFSPSLNAQSREVRIEVAQALKAAVESTPPPLET